MCKKAAVRLADLALLYDTGGPSDEADQVNPPVRVAVCRGQETQRLVKWAKLVLG